MTINSLINGATPVVPLVTFPPYIPGTVVAERSYVKIVKA